MLARDNQVGRLEHGRHAQRKQTVEIDRAERIVIADGRLFLEDHRTFVQAIGRSENGEAGFGLTLDEGPVDRRWAAELGQQRRVILDGAVLWNVDEFLRSELQHEGHDADVGFGVGQRPRRFRRAQGLELVDLELLFLGRSAQGVGSSTLLLRRAEHGGNLVAAREKGFQNGFAEVLLADYCDFHG